MKNLDSIKSSSKQIAEIAKKIGKEKGIDETELLNSSELNEIFNEAVKEFDQLQNELDENGL